MDPEQDMNGDEGRAPAPLDTEALRSLVAQFDALSDTIEQVRASLPPADDAEEADPNDEADDAAAGESEADEPAAAAGPSQPDIPPSGTGGGGDIAKSAAISMIAKRLGGR